MARNQGIELFEVLGQGSEGSVFSATQVSLGRRVAAKVIDGAPSAEECDRLWAEARITASLDHPHILPVYDLASDDHGAPVMLMKQVDGRPWSDSIGRDLNQDFEHFFKVADAIAYAHSCGIIHRDIKPDNILIGSYGRVFVADWGLSTTLDAAAVTTDVNGTLSYMAPEMLAADGRIGVCSDIYLLGSVLFEIVEGRPPHARKSVGEALKSIRRGQLTCSDKVPDALRSIIAKATDADPDNRYQSVVALQAALEKYVKDRDAHRLLRSADSRAKQVNKLIARRDSGMRPQLERAYLEARFGYEQVLDIAGLAQAEMGLKQLLTALIEHELEVGNVAKARDIAVSSRHVDTALRRRVRDELQKNIQEAQENSRLAKLGSKNSRRDARVLLKRLVFLVLLAWLTKIIATAVLTSTEGNHFVGRVMLEAAGLLFVGFMASRYWQLLAKNTWVKVFLGFIALELVIGSTAYLFALHYGADVSSASMVRYAIDATLIAAFAIAFEPRLLIVAVVFAGFCLLSGGALGWQSALIRAARDLACVASTVLILSSRRRVCRGKVAEVIERTRLGTPALGTRMSDTLI